MRKNLIFTFFACCFCLAGFSQNWEAFTSGRTYHYKSDTATGLPDQSIHFDSVEVLGADTAFSVARRFVFPVDTSLRNMPMFIGREMRAFADGTFNFKNPHNLAVPTQAALGSSFTLDSISGLIAAVTRVYQRPVFGLTLDSVKVFTTMTLDSLVLSKAHGILEWPASLGGSRFSLSGIQELHVGDTLPGFDGIFDLPVGADFFYESEYTEGDLIEQGESFRVKFHVDTNQRVMGGFHIAWSGIVRQTSTLGGVVQGVTINTTGGSFMIEDRPNSILEKSHHEQVRAPRMMQPFAMPAPWATYLSTPAVDSLNLAWNGLWTTMTHQRNAGKTELHLGRSNGAIGWLYYGLGGDTCVRSNDEHIRAVFREGMGVTHVEFGTFFSSGTFDLVGSIINGDTSGTIITDGELLASADMLTEHLIWSAAPNPANDAIELQWSHNKATEIQLLDLSGKVIVNQSARGLGTTLDVQSLPAGLYLLRLTQAGAQATKRVVIFH